MSVSIEIFPVEKSCEQGCPPCPLARRNNPITATTIHPEVQKSFSLLENALNRFSIKYDLHLSSTFNLVPALKHPKLINMARFTTNKADLSIEGTRKFSDDIHALFDKYKISPKTIGYSLVPDSPAISPQEIDIIREINREISRWYFTSPHREIEVTIRSNLIKLALYDQILVQAFQADASFVKGLVEEFSETCIQKAKIEEHLDSRMYANLYRGIYKKRTLSIINRIITGKQIPDTVKATVHQTMLLYPADAHSIQDFAIAPKGVMLIHSSVAINNPILWITHHDFRTSLAKELREKKSKFSSLKFLQRMMRENQIMYKFFSGEAHRQKITGPIGFMKTYEHNRMKMRKQIEK